MESKEDFEVFDKHLDKDNSYKSLGNGRWYNDYMYQEALKLKQPQKSLDSGESGSVDVEVFMLGVKDAYQLLEWDKFEKVLISKIQQLNKAEKGSVDIKDFINSKRFKQRVGQIVAAKNKIGYKVVGIQDLIIDELLQQYNKPTVREWISVDKELPKCKDKGFVKCMVVRGGITKSVFEAMYNTLTKDFQQTNYEKLDSITYWQPLPQPP